MPENTTSTSTTPNVKPLFAYGRNYAHVTRPEFKSIVTSAIPQGIDTLTRKMLLPNIKLMITSALTQLETTRAQALQMSENVKIALAMQSAQNADKLARAYMQELTDAHVELLAAQEREYRIIEKIRKECGAEGDKFSVRVEREDQADKLCYVLRIESTKTLSPVQSSVKIKTAVDSAIKSERSHEKTYTLAGVTLTGSAKDACEKFGVKLWVSPRDNRPNYAESIRQFNSREHKANRATITIA